MTEEIVSLANIVEMYDRVICDGFGAAETNIIGCGACGGKFYLLAYFGEKKWRFQTPAFGFSVQHRLASCGGGVDGWKDSKQKWRSVADVLEYIGKINGGVMTEAIIKREGLAVAETATQNGAAYVTSRARSE